MRVAVQKKLSELKQFVRLECTYEGIPLLTERGSICIITRGLSVVIRPWSFTVSYFTSGISRKLDKLQLRYLQCDCERFVANINSVFGRIIWSLCRTKHLFPTCRFSEVMGVYRNVVAQKSLVYYIQHPVTCKLLWRSRASLRLHFKRDFYIRYFWPCSTASDVLPRR